MKTVNGKQIKPNKQFNSSVVDLLTALVQTAEGGSMESSESQVLRMYWADQIDKMRLKMARRTIKQLPLIGHSTNQTVRQIADGYDLRKVVLMLTTELMVSIIESDYGIKLSSNQSAQVGI